MMKSKVVYLSLLLLAGAPPLAAGELAAVSAPVREQARQPKGADEYWKAMGLMQNGAPTDWKAARQALQQAADADYVPARLQLALCLQNGSYGFSKNPRKAFQQYRKAADRGSGFAMVSLGVAFLEGNGCKKHPEKAREQLLAAVGEKASYQRPLPPAGFQLPPQQLASNSSLASAMPEADAGDQARGVAFASLGDLATQQGKLSQAQEWYLKGASLGTASNYSAIVKAAVNLALGSGCGRDQDRAVALFEQAHRMGRRMGAAYAHSLVEQKLLDDFVQGELEEELKTQGDQDLIKLYSHIANVLGNDKGPGYDPAGAALWYRRAFEEGDSWSGLRLAFWYLEGSLGTVDEKAAFVLFEKLGGEGALNISAANLAICLERGIGTPRDQARAAAIFEKYRDQEYLCHLGATGRCPERPVDYVEALELHRRAATEGKDAQAQYLWGQRCEMGWGVEKNLAEAVTWYQASATHGNPNALCAIGLVYEFHPELMKEKPLQGAAAEAFRYYQLAADAGNPYAMQNIASCYMDGKGVAANEEKAEEWFYRCLKVRPDHSTAHNNYANLLHRQYERAKAAGNAIEAAALRERFLVHYRTAAEAGNSYAQRNLATCYLDGVLPDPEHRNAYRYFDAAAVQGDVIARRQLGIMLEEGIGVPVTCQEAAYHYRIAALAGDLIALRRLCNLCLEGRGVSQDTRRASFWLGKLADQTKEVAPLIALGDLMLRNGDLDEAREIFLKLSTGQENVWTCVARYRLAFLHEKGLGVKRDAAKAAQLRTAAFKGQDPAALYNIALAMRKQRILPGAFDLLEMASDMGLREARSALAWSLITGEFTLRDGERGWALLRGLVREGDTEALTWTAYATLQGIEGAPGLDEAIECARKASSSGSTRAAEVLAALRRRAGS